MSISLDLASGKAALPETRQSLIGLTRAEMRDQLVQDLNLEPKQAKMRASQIWRWLYLQGTKDFAQMTNIGKDLRNTLEKTYALTRPEIVEKQVSTDGTRKYLIRLAPGIEVESVFIPDVGRYGALCVSSQVGCTLTCTFCHTGTQKLVRNLTPGEIVAQVMILKDDLNEWGGTAQVQKEGGPESGRHLSNIVFMGMGEPLYNLPSVANAIEIISDPEGIAISRRRITVSTSGVVPEMKALGEQTETMLAISLHATNDKLRDELVPINRKYNIETLIEACRQYPGVSNARRITFEYVMLKGVNDSNAEARELVRLLKGVPAKINLIPFNPWPNSPYECSDWDRIEEFADIVNQAGYASPIRTPRGRDIAAACGQLKSESVKQRASEKRLAAKKLTDTAAEL